MSDQIVRRAGVDHLSMRIGVLKEAKKAPHPLLRTRAQGIWCANAIRQHCCRRSLPIGRLAVDRSFGGRLSVESLAYN